MSKAQQIVLMMALGLWIGGPIAIAILTQDPIWLIPAAMAFCILMAG